MKYAVCIIPAGLNVRTIPCTSKIDALQSADSLLEESNANGFYIERPASIIPKSTLKNGQRVTAQYHVRACFGGERLRTIEIVESN